MGEKKNPRVGGVGSNSKGGENNPPTPPVGGGGKRGTVVFFHAKVKKFEKGKMGKKVVFFFGKIFFHSNPGGDLKNFFRGKSPVWE